MSGRVWTRGKLYRRGNWYGLPSLCLVPDVLTLPHFPYISNTTVLARPVPSCVSHRLFFMLVRNARTTLPERWCVQPVLQVLPHHPARAAPPPRRSPDWPPAENGRSARRDIKSRADTLYRELCLHQTTLEMQGMADHLLRREIKERKAVIDAELDQASSNVSLRRCVW